MSTKTTTQERPMSNATITRNNNTENRMIAADLRAAGFKAEVQAEYGVVKAILNRRELAGYEIIQALEQAGYDECQYKINGACGAVFIRAIVA
jgi:hypothetical protein